MLSLYERLQEAQLENLKLKKQLEEVRKQLESEALARVDMENRCQSLKEELEFKTNVSSEAGRRRHAGPMGTSICTD